MLINQPVSREVWRKLVASLKEAATAEYIPEYDHRHERSMNKRYYR